MLLTLIYDGGCPFCREFALRSELQAGVPNLRIVDGRADHTRSVASSMPSACLCAMAPF